MSPSTLVVAYFGIGVAGAALVIHRARRDPSTDGVAASAASALAMLILWPLWAPFAFAPAGVTPPSSDPIEPAGDDHPLVASIAVALRVDGVFVPQERIRIEREVERAAARLLAVERLLERERLRPRDAAHLPSSLHGAARRRLEAAHARDVANLEALAELVDLLAAELVLARHGSGEGTDELVAALWARVEMLHDVGDG